MSHFLRNAWYVAALSPQVGRTLLPLRLLGESVVSVHETLNVPRLVSTKAEHRSRWRTPARIASCRCRWAGSRAMPSSAATTD